MVTEIVESKIIEQKDMLNQMFSLSRSTLRQDNAKEIKKRVKHIERKRGRIDYAIVSSPHQQSDKKSIVLSIGLFYYTNFNSPRNAKS